jgi:hypothetical protein
MTARLPTVILPCEYSVTPSAMPHSSARSRFQGAQIVTPGYTCTPLPTFAPNRRSTIERQPCNGRGENRNRRSDATDQSKRARRLPSEKEGPTKVSSLCINRKSRKAVECFRSGLRVALANMMVNVVSPFLQRPERGQLLAGSAHGTQLRIVGFGYQAQGA